MGLASEFNPLGRAKRGGGRQENKQQAFCLGILITNWLIDQQQSMRGSNACCRLLFPHGLARWS